jgi:hypothetical protein
LNRKVLVTRFPLLRPTGIILLTVKSYPALTAFFGLDVEGESACRNPDCDSVDDGADDSADAWKRGFDRKRESTDLNENERETESSGRNGENADEDEQMGVVDGASRFRRDRFTPLSGGVIVFSSKPSSSTFTSIPLSSTRK